MKKIVIFLLGISMGIILSACGTERAENVESAETMETAGSVESLAAESEVQEETTVEESVTEESVAEITLAAGFDEEFTMQLGDNIYVGNEDTRIFLSQLEYSDGLDLTIISYQLMIGENVYEGTAEWSEEKGARISQDVYAKNRVRFISVDKGESVTLMITSGAEVQAPLSLSGNAEEKYVTTKQEYIESDDFILFLDAGMTVNGDIEEQIKTIIKLVEKEMGYHLINDSRFSLDRESDINWLYGEGAFDGVDPNMEKFHIYAVPDGGCAPLYASYSVIINQIDLDITEGEGGVIAHELIHAVQMTNGVDMGTTMNEGIATYVSGQICDRDEILTFNFDATNNYLYEYRSTPITVDNSEQEFLQDYGDKWENYIYGYHFITYLCETYGEDIYLDIFAEATKRAGDEAVMYTGSLLTDLIKEMTTKTVFTDFAEWIQ